MDSENNPSADPVRLKLNFRASSKMPSVYAHHMTVQPGEHEILLSFYEVILPLTVENSEEQIKLLQETGVTAECVARITVALNRFPGFAQAMQQVSSQITSALQGTEEEQSNADSSRNDQENK